MFKSRLQQSQLYHGVSMAVHVQLLISLVPDKLKLPWVSFVQATVQVTFYLLAPRDHWRHTYNVQWEFDLGFDLEWPCDIDLTWIWPWYVIEPFSVTPWCWSTGWRSWLKSTLVQINLFKVYDPKTKESKVEYVEHLISVSEIKKRPELCEKDSLPDNYLELKPW